VLCYAAVFPLTGAEDEQAEEFLEYYGFAPEPGMQFPPTFIWQSFQDTLISFDTAAQLTKFLRELETPVELHLFPYGAHGQGLAPYMQGQENDDNYLTQVWSELCIRWLHFYGF